MSFEIKYPAPYVTFFFFFLGILGRTIYPYAKKIREQRALNDERIAKGEPPLPSLKFDKLYLLTFLSDVFLSFIATMLFFNTWSPPEGTLFQIAIAGFIAGWGSQDLINRLV